MAEMGHHRHHFPRFLLRVSERQHRPANPCKRERERDAHSSNRTNASAVYTATYTQMDAEFGNSRLVATLGLSTFVLGIALGPFWSPLAEFYGRRPIYLASFAAFMVFLIPSAVAQNIETMIVVRFFQGLAGSAFLSVSGGTVSDLFARNEMQAPMAIFTTAPFIGPSTGPLIGGLTNYFISWRWTHYIKLMESAVLIVSLFFFVPETYRESSLLCVRAVLMPLTKKTTQTPSSSPKKPNTSAKPRRTNATTLPWTRHQGPSAPPSATRCCGPSRSSSSNPWLSSSISTLPCSSAYSTSSSVPFLWSLPVTTASTSGKSA